MNYKFRITDHCQDQNKKKKVAPFQLKLLLQKKSTEKRCKTARNFPACLETNTFQFLSGSVNASKTREMENWGKKWEHTFRICGTTIKFTIKVHLFTCGTAVKVHSARMKQIQQLQKANESQRKKRKKKQVLKDVCTMGGGGGMTG